MSREKRDLAEAKERTARARRYAEKFPQFIYPSDLAFQTVEWQLAQLQGFKEKCAPEK